MNNVFQEKKAQSSIEFLILVVAVLFFFVVFLFGLQNNIGDKTRERNNLEFKELALTVQDEINLALEASEGYSRHFNIPEKLINRNYEINIVSGTVYVRTLDNEFALALPVGNVTGNINKGDNFIRNINGRIFLN